MKVSNPHISHILGFVLLGWCGALEYQTLAGLYPGNPRHILHQNTATTLGTGLARGMVIDGTNFFAALQATNGQISVNGVSLGRGGSPPLFGASGTNYLMAWADTEELPSDLYGQFRSRDGVSLGPPFLIRADIGATNLGAIVSDGTNYLVTWETPSTGTSIAATVQAQFVAETGAPWGDAFQISGEEESRYPVLAFDGTNYLAVWMARQADTNLWNIRGRHISRDGLLLDPFTISEVPFSSANPIAVCFGRTNFLWPGVGRMAHSELLPINGTYMFLRD